MAEHCASCQCGGLTLKIGKDPEFGVLCNCTLCQMRGGGPFGVGYYVQQRHCQTVGPYETWGRPADTGRMVVNHFCPTCGTTVYWTLEMRPGYVGVALGTFKDKPPMPDRAIWAQEAHDWMVFPEEMPVFQKATPKT